MDTEFEIDEDTVPAAELAKRKRKQEYAAAKAQRKLEGKLAKEQKRLERQMAQKERDAELWGALKRGIDADSEQKNRGNDSQE